MDIGKTTRCYEVLESACLVNHSGNEKYYLEKISLKERKQEEIRLSWAKKDSRGYYQFLKHPLEIHEDDVFALFKLGIEQKVISTVLRAGLKTVIRRTHPPPRPERALAVGEYCDFYARAIIDAENRQPRMERIFIKGINSYKIRFASYRQNDNDHWGLLMYPLDLNEVEFMDLFEDAVAKGVYSKVFLTAMLSIL